MKTINKVILLLFSIALISCEDILEEDITDKTATIISPQDGVVIESNVVTFQWNTISGADKYRVQVFLQNQVMVKDSLVENSNVTLPLPQGNYQWRVRGENFAYQSSYSLTNSFSVQESDDLSTQQVLPSSPSDNAYKNTQNITLSWNALNAADYYELQVVNVTNSNTIVLQQSNITATTYTLNNSVLSQDAKYEWKVKAVNTTTTTSTQYSSRFLFLDRVLPNQPQNVLPANNSVGTLNQDINFSWSIPADSGTIQSAITYEIEIATDVAFANIVQTSASSSSNFQRSFTTAGDYYWRVRAKDAAGNVGVNSSSFKITVN